MCVCVCVCVYLCFSTIINIEPINISAERIPLFELTLFH